MRRGNNSPRRSKRKSSTPQRNGRASDGRPSLIYHTERKRPRQVQVLSEIRRLQQFTGYVMPKLSFSRVVREILTTYSPGEIIFRITAEAFEALQESTELYLTQLFTDSYLCTLHRDRVTLMVKDLQLTRYLR